MNASRIILIVAGCALTLACAHAQQPFPNRAIRLIVPSLPGGGTDISARLIAPKMSEILGHQVVVENRAGAASMIGSELVARAAPDGHTLLMGIATLTINPHIQRKLPFDVAKDLAPVSQAVIVPNALIVHPSVPVKNMKAFIAFARAHPNQLSYASAGVGSNLHLTMALLLNMANIQLVHVPYKGSGGATVDLLSGQVAAMTTTTLSAMPLIRSNRLRALGVTGAKRSAVLPDIPTISEAALPGYEAVQWYGVLAPAGTPRDSIGKLHAAVTRALQESTVKERLLGDGAETVGNTPDEFAAVIRRDLVKWGKVIKDAGITAE
ncbi:MAG: tripartite tricarboxylate transporter substrate binding protein [Burkholderiales bacterium]